MAPALTGAATKVSAKILKKTKLGKMDFNDGIVNRPLRKLKGMIKKIFNLV